MSLYIEKGLVLGVIPEQVHMSYQHNTGQAESQSSVPRQMSGLIGSKLHSSKEITYIVSLWTFCLKHVRFFLTITLVDHMSASIGQNLDLQYHL